MDRAFESFVNIHDLSKVLSNEWARHILYLYLKGKYNGKRESLGTLFI